MDTKWNALGFRPGLVGGHCIGVDPYYFTYEAEKLGYHSQIILSGRKVNDGMGTYVADATIKQLTDLFNKAFPVIRYENGDLVSLHRNSEGKLYFDQIAGRKIDTLYTTDGRMVHYFEGISFLEQYMDIRQFQLIQYDYDHFKWVLNTDNHSYEDMIIQESKAVFGKNSKWEFEYVDELPKLRSGKVKMTVCLIPGLNEI